MAGEVGIGVIGCGRVAGLRHLPALARLTGARVVAAADVDAARLREASARARFLASNNLAARADRLAAAGGFDEAFTSSEDRELCDRWLARGGRIVLAPEAVVEHAHDLTLARFAAQHFGYGRGALRFHRARARRGSGRFVDETTFHLRLPALLRQRGAALRAGPLLLLWQAANAAGFGWEAVASLARRPAPERVPA